MVSQMKVDRVRKDFTQTSLGLRSGIPQHRISLIERGLIPDNTEAKRIAKALGAKVRDLFPFVHQGGGGDLLRG